MNTFHVHTYYIRSYLNITLKIQNEIIFCICTQLTTILESLVWYSNTRVDENNTKFYILHLLYCLSPSSLFNIYSFFD